MESIVEQQRRYHEERERCIDTMVKENVNKKSTHRDSINSEHRTKMLLDRYFDCTQKLKEVYEDKDGERKEEIQALSGPNEFGEFYKRLKTVKEFYKRHPNEISVPMSVEFDEYNKMRESNSEEYQNLVEFTDEEGYGKHLDLHELYTEYLNIKGVEKYDYIAFLNVFDRLYEIPKDKKGVEYRNYLEHLLEYLYDFLARIKPLGNFDAIFYDIQQDFYRQWDMGQFPGWPKQTTTGALTNIGAYLDLSGFNSEEELVSLGLDRLKSALVALNLKCGGTVEERAKRLFSVKGLLPDQYPAEILVKKKGKGTKSNEIAVYEQNKETALLEAQVYRLTELLSEQRASTRDNVTRKQARTEGEREDEDEEEPEASESEEEDDDDIPYNPKNLPLGWDGKPIPYWLYKLHGLNISYNCEICGNFTYKGPKAFQRHFAEWRHAHGMRCLGIPNTAHFANVTNIEDALKLWDKIKDNKSSDRWLPEQEEEFEDSRGNVVNRKTFEDLKRQGLL